MTGSDPSGKTDEIDLGGLDFSAGLDLELAGSRPVDLSQPDPSQVETAGAGTVVDLALDLLEPTRLVSPRQENSEPSAQGNAEVVDQDRLEKTVALAAPSVADDKDRSASLEPMGGDGLAEVMPVFVSSPRPAAVEPSGLHSSREPSARGPASVAAARSPWDELDGWIAKLDRLIASSSPRAVGAARATGGGLEQERESFGLGEGAGDPPLEIRVEPDGAPDAREGLDLAVAFFEMGAFESARRVLTLMRGHDPGRAAQADAILARLALQEGRAHEALRICDLWRSRDGLTEDELLDFQYQSARSLEDLGRFAEAVAEYRALLVRSSSYRDVAIRLNRLSRGLS